jgi:hypothetical protein
MAVIEDGMFCLLENGRSRPQVRDELIRLRGRPGRLVVGIDFHEPCSDCGDDPGIVVSVGHKTIEQHDPRCGLLASRLLGVVGQVTSR